ncbi:peroxidase superfamily protein, partial [Striga asiatica]
NKRGRPRKVPAGPVIEPVGGVSSSTICEPDGGGSSRISRKTSTRSKKKQSSRTAIHKERAMAMKGVGILQSEETGNIYMRMSAGKGIHFIPSRKSTLSTKNKGKRSGDNSQGAENIGTQESVAEAS